MEIGTLITNSTFQCLRVLRKEANGFLGVFEPCAIFFLAVVFTLIVLEIWDFLCQDEPLFNRLKVSAFRLVRNLPIIKGYVDKELQKTCLSIEEEVLGSKKGMPFIYTLPPEGWTKEHILQETDNYTALGDFDWASGRVSGTVYHYDSELVSLATDIYGKCAWNNPLHHDVFPGIQKMESEIVRMVCSMYSGGPETCGVVTSGGTESILMACKAYRDRALAMGFKRPQMVVPVTAHAAFDKAASYMNVRITHVPIDPHTCKVNLSAMKRAITKNTFMLVASAPNFPHGIIDPVEEVARLGLKYNIPVHVDACLGGFLIPFMEKAGFPLPRFDFRVPGVCSISCDTHKYGAAPKGTSVLVYRDRQLRHFQYFVAPDWPGGIYASPSIPGSRSGGVIATCWATMLHLGDKGYLDLTRKIISTARTIEQGLRDIEHIYILGQPQVSVIAIGSKDFNIYRLSDLLSKKGWNFNALQFPSSVHFCVTMMHTNETIVKELLKDVRETVETIMKDPKNDEGGKAAIYGVAQSIPDRTMVSEIAWHYLDSCYSTSELKGTEQKTKAD